MNATATDLVFDPIVPGPLVALLGVALLSLTVWAYLRLGNHLSRAKNLALLLFRLAGLTLVLLLLLQPSRLVTIPPPVKEHVTLVAVDTSLSMKQQDVERATRIEAAKSLLRDSGATPRAGAAPDPRLRLFEFSEDAAPFNSNVLDLAPKGRSTRVHRSVLTMLNTLAGDEAARALVLVTDGHDFELVNPSKTALAARAHNVPIYAVPLGKQGKVRDISTRITSYQPYTYVKQKARIAATLRLIGCEFEDIQVQLLRHGQVAQTKRVAAEELQELPVEFEVVEPETGQFEYEFRTVPLEGEVDTANNSAITYLNVIDQRIRVLALEGAPYWDTTFLQRSLMRNDKFEVDSLVQYAPRRVRPIRKGEIAVDLKVPATADEFRRYDVIILGRSVDRLMNRQQLGLLQDFVQNGAGTVVFSRGPAFDGELAKNDLEPVLWGDVQKERVRLQVAREGQSASPFRSLTEQPGGTESLPELLSVRNAADRKPLTATLAVAADRGGNATVPGLLHRRFGSGQVVSIAVEGLWRWGFNPKVEGANTAFDRFWDQMILWLLAGREFTPAKEFSFRTSSANVQLGEKVYFRLNLRSPDPRVKTVPLKLFLGENEIARLTLAPGTSQDATKLTAEFLPEKLGRYRVAAALPDGSTLESRFIVFTENLEETEVATDVTYLKRLCEASGGRLLQPDELGKLIAEFRDEKSDAAPKTRLKSAWDQTWVFYFTGLLFGVDWYLRRRWGLS